MKYQVRGCGDSKTWVWITSPYFNTHTKFLYIYALISDADELQLVFDRFIPRVFVRIGNWSTVDMYLTIMTPRATLS